MDGPLAADAPSTRRCSVRRAVRFEAEVASRAWPAAVPFEVRDLSPFGLCLDTDVLLPAGERVEVRFVPPRWPAWAPPLRVHGRVTRAHRDRRRTEGGRAGLGVVFEDLSAPHARLLARALRGLPPSLPGRPKPRPTVRVRPRGTPVRFEALGALLTGSGPSRAS